VLKADADIVVPYDDDRFDFTVGAEGALSINRSLYEVRSRSTQDST